MAGLILTLPYFPLKKMAKVIVAKRAGASQFVGRFSGKSLQFLAA
jgi:hypothetical protein